MTWRHNIKCPRCSGDRIQVLNENVSTDRISYYRRHGCAKCAHIWSTREVGDEYLKGLEMIARQVEVKRKVAGLPRADTMQGVA